MRRRICPFHVSQLGTNREDTHLHDAVMPVDALNLLAITWSKEEVVIEKKIFDLR
jgi:hypothetical protein